MFVSARLRASLVVVLSNIPAATMRWTAPKIHGCIPQKRSAHSASLYNGTLYVFGGWNGKRELNDVYALDTSACKPHRGAFYTSISCLLLLPPQIIVVSDTLEWKLVEATGTVPSPRHFHNGVIVGQRLYVFGGFDGKVWKDDIFVLDLGKTVYIVSMLDS